MDSCAVKNDDRIFVFGTDESGRHENATAQLAVSRWGAQRLQGKGLVGNSYAIPVRTRENEHFSRERLKAEFDEFKAFAAANLDKQFVLSRIGCDEIGFSDAKVAPHFAQCGDNVIEPGRWIRRRNPSHLVLAVVGSAECVHEQSVQWAVEMTVGLSGGSKAFVVSDDEGADEIACKWLLDKGADVVVEHIDSDLYGKRAVAIRNRMIALPATHVLIMDSGGDQKCAHMRKTAAAEGLEVYEMKIQALQQSGADPEVARKALAELHRLAQSGVSAPPKGPKMSGM